jgi:hypothetical protein
VGPLPKKAPTAYLKDGQLFFDTIVFTPEALRHLIAETGPGQIMIGTDYPFPWTSTEIDLVLKTPGLNDEQRIAILGGTAAKLLGISDPEKHMDQRHCRRRHRRHGDPKAICHALAAEGCHIAVVYAQIGPGDHRRATLKAPGCRGFRPRRHQARLCSAWSTMSASALAA